MDKKTDICRYLEELDEFNVDVYFKDLLRNSVGYMLLERCGFDGEEYFDIEDFREIANFNTKETISVLGAASRDISSMVLLEIEKTVRSIKRHEKTQNRTFDKNDESIDNSIEEKTIERSTENDEPNHLQTRGRLLDSESRSTGVPEGGQIWNVATHVSSGTQEREVHEVVYDGKTERASGASGQGSQRNDGEIGEEIGGSSASNGNPQSGGSNVVGSEDEQHSLSGGGNRTERVDLPLIEGDPFTSEGVEYFHQDYEKCELIKNSPALKDHRVEIATYFRDHQDPKERGDFIMQFFDDKPQEFILSNGVTAGYKAYKNRIHLWRGSHDSRERDCYVPWRNIANYIKGMILMHTWDESLFPTEQEQIERIKAQGEKKLYLPQEAIDYVLGAGSSFSEGKLRIYRQFAKNETADKNIAFLKNEYGQGGRSDAIPGTGYWESHDAKGICIEDHYVTDTKNLLSWSYVNKRIKELIDADRYLSAKEKEAYPTFLKKTEDTNKRWEIAKEFRSIVRDYNDFQEQLGNNEDTLNTYVLVDCSSEFGIGKKLTYTSHAKGDFVLPLMREAMNKIIAENTHLTERCEKVLEALNSDIARPLEPTYDELNPPPEPPKEYKYHLGDKALENMNFKTGNILEPSCGIGNFMGMLPESLGSSKIYGIELDSISSRIAQQLYQNSSIASRGYEATDLPDSFFDCAIGNVPFGQFKALDKRYDKHNFLIHDYFFARTLDKVRPGGIVAFITSKGTLDKENPNVRKYIAQRADLIGAIRLPNNTFKSAAGTEVTSDIIFLQKRDRIIDADPDWVHLNTDENGVKMNQYFVDNPEMIMGEMKMVSGPFGPESACVPYEDKDLEEMLSDAIQNIHAEVTEYEFEDFEDDEIDNSIPADPDVRNFSYTIYDGKVYYRENSRMKPVDVSMTAENRIKGLIEIRDCVRTLIEYQTEDYPDYEIKKQQYKLNEIYDRFNKKYGRINSRANSSAFSSDNSYFLLTSLEVLDEEGNFVRKADMFNKRTIKQKVAVTSVDTASEALSVSLAEHTKVDIPFMAELTGKTEDEIIEDLTGVIFQNIGGEDENEYVTADEYLSGNVREKLRIARLKNEADGNDSFAVNVKALEAVQPTDLTASEISVRLGATWLPTDVIDDFMYELFSMAYYMRYNVKTHYSKYTGEWNIQGKNYDRSNVKAYNTYGTSRINGFKILEETLNLRDVRIFDYIEDEKGNKVAVLNKKETAIAQGKQELIKNAFQEWIWNDPERRERLCKMYNEKFNSHRAREYDGDHLNFVGINPEITLRKHQVDAVARGIYGQNELLAHVVGAGKTFTMVAIAQESKRLGLCQKSMFVVPNHLTSQWASEYLQLYPSANILVATKKDFETKNRKKFCGRIATGDYDAVIIGHSQFEKIPMSQERQIII